MGVLSLILLVPLAWPFFAKALWKREITLAEMGLNLAVGVLVAVGGYYASMHVQASDVEIWNGLLREKQSERVSCTHSYSCNCKQVCTGSGQNRSCSQQCDTCYEHNYDVDWNLKTDVGTVEIDRVDRQGIHEPPRFSRAKLGDPVALAKPFQNYIKAAPDSLFNASSEQMLKAQFQGKLLPYPAEVYDYHYVNRVITQGVNVPTLPAWNAALAQTLAKLGPSKQVNAIIVFSKENDPNYAEALRAAWLGGKKNDVVVVLGTPEYPKIAWVRVFSWTDKELFKVELRDELFNLQEVDIDKVMAVLATHIEKQFVRKHMADFEYLKNEATPPTWLAILLAVLAAGTSIGLSLYLSRNEYRSFRF